MSDEQKPTQDKPTTTSAKDVEVNLASTRLSSTSEVPAVEVTTEPPAAAVEPPLTSTEFPADDAADTIPAEDIIETGSDETEVLPREAVAAALEMKKLEDETADKAKILQNAQEITAEIVERRVKRSATFKRAFRANEDASEQLEESFENVQTTHNIVGGILDQIEGELGVMDNVIDRSAKKIEMEEALREERKPVPPPQATQAPRPPSLIEKKRAEDEARRAAQAAEAARLQAEHAAFAEKHKAERAAEQERLRAERAAMDAKLREERERKRLEREAYEAQQRGEKPTPPAPSAPAPKPTKPAGHDPVSRLSKKEDE